MRRRTAQEPVEIDVLQKKKEELAQFVDRYNNAVCIYDKCLTELEPEEDNGTTLTGMWFCPLDDEVAHKISKKYQLYK